MNQYTYTGLRGLLGIEIMAIATADSFTSGVAQCVVAQDTKYFIDLLISAVYTNSIYFLHTYSRSLFDVI